MGTESGATYLNGEGSYTEYMPGDKSYRFSGGDYKVTQQAINAGYNYVDGYSTSGSIITLNCDGTNIIVGSSVDYCSTLYYYLSYDTNVTQYSTYNQAASQAINDGYLTTGVNNNYVCFGSTASTCPYDNLYRIMGIFDDDNDGKYNVKLIKADFASTTELGTNEQNGTTATELYNGNIVKIPASDYSGYNGSKSMVDVFRWSGSTTNSNRWDSSTLRSLILNGYYLNTYLGNTWKSKIIETTYYLGGPGKITYVIPDVFENNDYSPKGLYTYERDATTVYDTSSYPASINDYIGLMYASDYAYAANQSLWSASSVSGTRGTDWLYNGLDEHMNTPDYSRDFLVRGIEYRNGASLNNAATIAGIRPVFYLDSSVELTSGTGTKTNPYYIKLT